MGRHEGTTVIVTGGGGGIGSAICDVFAGEGARVAVWDITTDAGRAVAERLEGARPYALDITDSAAVDAAVDEVVADFGRLDTLINCAGISRVGDYTHELSDEIWHQSIGVMQTGLFFCSRAAGRRMIEQRSGSIVNISSIRGFSPNPGRLAYCASKGAVLMMTRVMAGEWAQFGVRVNSVAPGVQAAGMWNEEVERGVGDVDHLLQVIPAGRFGEAQEVGRLCSFLASEEAGYITGACVTIDGGLTSIPAA